MSAAKLGRCFLGNNKIVSFDDMGFYRILDDIRNIDQFTNIKKDVFHYLKKYDEKNNANLYKTLTELIYNNMDTYLTSKSLYVHKNTVHYRKKQITEILGYVPWEMPYLFNTLLAVVTDYFE